MDLSCTHDAKEEARIGAWAGSRHRMPPRLLKRPSSRLLRTAISGENGGGQLCSMRRAGTKAPGTRRRCVHEGGGTTRINRQRTAQQTGSPDRHYAASGRALSSKPAAIPGSWLSMGRQLQGVWANPLRVHACFHANPLAWDPSPTRIAVLFQLFKAKRCTQDGLGTKIAGFGGQGLGWRTEYCGPDPSFV
jgi:hypothetical protein